MKEISDNILSVKQFTETIEMYVKKRDCTYIDALTLYAEENEIEIETVASFVKNSHVLKAKLAAESEENKTIKPQGSKLPL
jgi:hypothetical protein